MQFSYNLGKLKYPNYEFTLDDGRWIDIDLVKYYSNYRLVKNNISDENWDFTVTNSLDENNIGNVIDIPYKKIRHFNAFPNIVLYKNVTCKRSTQTELDKYLYKIDKSNDNGKLYKYIYDIIHEDLENKKNKKSKFVEIVL